LSELSLLGREYQSSQPGCMQYAQILRALISLTSAYRENKKRQLWQAIERNSGFRDRVPLSNVFKAMNVVGHPLVANHMCDEGSLKLLRPASIASHSADRNDGRHAAAPHIDFSRYR
jgi:hypothetical protein